MLNERAAADASLPGFILPGRHGAIYPWLPPPGLPMDILRPLRNTLAQTVVKLIIIGLRPKSGQTETAVWNGLLRRRRRR
ncbi:hypothetical protein C8Q80DRAFT_831656 [Daedaleopsis nitida]|nr:hypothetical protein C8Q80DRAFT_831656 [Daedaleopsis nitida]